MVSSVKLPSSAIAKWSRTHCGALSCTERMTSTCADGGRVRAIQAAKSSFSLREVSPVTAKRERDSAAVHSEIE